MNSTSIEQNTLPTGKGKTKKTGPLLIIGILTVMIFLLIVCSTGAFVTGMAFNQSNTDHCLSCENKLECEPCTCPGQDQPTPTIIIEDPDNGSISPTPTATTSEGGTTTESGEELRYQNLDMGIVITYPKSFSLTYKSQYSREYVLIRDEDETTYLQIDRLFRDVEPKITRLAAKPELIRLSNGRDAIKTRLTASKGIYYNTLIDDGSEYGSSSSFFPIQLNGADVYVSVGYTTKLDPEREKQFDAIIQSMQPVQG